MAENAQAPALEDMMEEHDRQVLRKAILDGSTILLDIHAGKTNLNRFGQSWRRIAVDFRGLKERTSDAAAARGLEYVFEPKGTLDKLGEDMAKSYRENDGKIGDELIRRAETIARAAREELDQISPGGYSRLGVSKEHLEEAISHIEAVGASKAPEENLASIEKAEFISDEHIQPYIKNGVDELELSPLSRKKSKANREKTSQGLKRASQEGKQIIRMNMRGNPNGMSEIEFGQEVFSMLLMELPAALKPGFIAAKGLIMGLIANPAMARIQTASKRRRAKRGRWKEHKEALKEIEKSRKASDQGGGFKKQEEEIANLNSGPKAEAKKTGAKEEGPYAGLWEASKRLAKDVGQARRESGPAIGKPEGQDQQRETGGIQL